MKKFQYIIQFFIFFLIVCFVVSIDAFSKDISFDEVPEAIQKIALREIGDVPIRDVDREREDGETVYDIEAKNDRIDKVGTDLQPVPKVFCEKAYSIS